jgi:signal transduction histidine kinase
MRRQLPVIASRLQQTLDKLRAPTSETSGLVSARNWWRSLRNSHYAGENVVFQEGEIPESALLPRELFESAADNLIQNALNKRKLQGDFAISVRFSCADEVVFEVCDAGPEIPEEMARELLRGPVPSDSGLGIGLYQVARHAETCGFVLALVRNARGEVCFALSNLHKPVAKPPVAATA